MGLIGPTSIKLLSFKKNSKFLSFGVDNPRRIKLLAILPMSGSFGVANPGRGGKSSTRLPWAILPKAGSFVVAQIAQGRLVRGCPPWVRQNFYLIRVGNLEWAKSLKKLILSRRQAKILNIKVFARLGFAAPDEPGLGKQFPKSGLSQFPSPDEIN